LKRLGLALAIAIGTAAPAAAQGFDIVKLIRNADPGVRDPGGWAADMLTGFAENKIEANRENICATIAIISQESGFAANPAVPGLGKLAEKALKDKFSAIPFLGPKILTYLESVPDPKASFMDQIRAAKTERDLDLAYRAMLAYVAGRTETGFIVNSGLLNRWIEERNDVSTIGSMQVSVAFALEVAKQDRWTAMSLADVYALRDELYTRKGGMKFGILQLLGYETGYDKKLYRFADYNAGRYSSRNAAFQQVVGKLAGVTLALDGDLLSYSRPGNAKDTVTNSERAIRAAAAALKLGLTDRDIRADLLKEKHAAFATTATFLKLRDAYTQANGKAPPFAILPEITLESVKIKRQFTTAIFAERVNARYQRCMAVKG
jgi:hypothetical protein